MKPLHNQILKTLSRTIPHTAAETRIAMHGIPLGLLYRSLSELAEREFITVVDSEQLETEFHTQLDAILNGETVQPTETPAKFLLTETGEQAVAFYVWRS